MVRPSRAQISGYYAGPVSRLLAYLIDVFLAVTVFGLLTAGTVWAINTVFEVNIEWNWEEGVFGLVLMLVWLFLYFWLGFALNGKTVGYSILGIKVVTPDGTIWAVKALSPGGLLHDVKGVKMLPNNIEATVHGVPIHSHIKALPQVIGSRH
jgi:uncharacterized RDD family membrane protein YckC